MNESAQPFEIDPYIESLLLLRAANPARFLSLPQDVIQLVEEYEREQKAHPAQRDQRNSHSA